MDDQIVSLLCDLTGTVERTEGKLDLLVGRLDNVESKVDSALGHIAVLNDAHVAAEQFQADVRGWRGVVDSWRGALDSKLRLAAWVGLAFTGLSALAAWGIDDILMHHFGLQ